MKTPQEIQVILREAIGTGWYDVSPEKRAELIVEYMKAEALNSVADSIDLIGSVLGTATDVVKQAYSYLVPEVKRLVDMIERVTDEDYPKTTSELS